MESPRSNLYADKLFVLYKDGKILRKEIRRGYAKRMKTYAYIDPMTARRQKTMQKADKVMVFEMRGELDEVCRYCKHDRAWHEEHRPRHIFRAVTR